MRRPRSRKGLQGLTRVISETGEGALGVEFAGSAVSSPSSYGSDKGKGPSYYTAIAKKLTATNSELQYAEGQLRGYVGASSRAHRLLSGWVDLRAQN